jgi:hypothetical protein
VGVQHCVCRAPNGASLAEQRPGIINMDCSRISDPTSLFSHVHSLTAETLASRLLSPFISMDDQAREDFKRA